MEVQFSNQTRSLAVIRSRRQGKDHDRDHVVHVLCTVQVNSDRSLFYAWMLLLDA